MAGGRKGRRKAGHRGPGENEAARDQQNAIAADADRHIAGESGDIEVEQWLNPFRIGRPVTPVISHRQNAADPAGSPHSHGLPRGETIRAVPVQAVPVEGAPDPGVPVQIWHDPPADEPWQQHGQRPIVESDRGDGRDRRGQPWAAHGEAGGYVPGTAAVHGDDYGPQAYYMDVPAPPPGSYPARDYHGERPGPEEHRQSVWYDDPPGFEPPQVYRGRERYRRGGRGRDEGYPTSRAPGSGDGYEPSEGYGPAENYSGYPPRAYAPPGGYGPPRGYGPSGGYGPPGSEGRRARGPGAGRESGHGDHDPRGRYVQADGYSSPDSSSSPSGPSGTSGPSGYVRHDGYVPPNGYGPSAGPPGPARLPPDFRAERYGPVSGQPGAMAGPGYRAEDHFPPDYDAGPRQRFGSRGYVQGRGPEPGNQRDQRNGFGPPAGYRGPPGHNPAESFGPDTGYGPDPGYGPATGYGQGGQRAPAPQDQHGRRDLGWADEGGRGQLPRRVRQRYGPNDPQAAADEPWRRDMRRPGGPGVPADPARQRPAADSDWDGRSRRGDDYGQQPRRQPAPGDRFWGPADAARYDAGGVRRGYDRRMRAAYGPGDAFSRGQGQWRDPSAGLPASGRGSDQADRAAGQRSVHDGPSAGPARKTVLPAALPPGPSAGDEAGNTIPTDTPPQSASSPPPAGSGTSATSTSSPQRADGSDRPEISPAPVTAPTRPSPTGTIPPAAGALPQPVGVAEPARAATGGYDVVSPDAETTPMAVILGDRPTDSEDAARPLLVPNPAAADQSAARPPRSTPAATSSGMRMRGPFEPANTLAPPPAAPPVQQSTRQRASVSAGSRPGTTGPEERAPDSGAGASTAASSGVSADASEVSEPSSAASAKIDQIKDLYLMADAVGEDVLDQHFQLVSDRQRQLIKEYFDQAISNPPDTSDAAS